MAREPSSSRISRSVPVRLPAGLTPELMEQIEQAPESERGRLRQVAEETRRLYVNGKTGYLDSLDAERVLANADTALAASQANIVNDQLALFLALGGGWGTDEKH